MESKKVYEIVDAEWEMFQATQNVGGRASCQDNKPTFYTMRISQFTNWTEDCIESYAEDVKAAAANGDNLVTYKYGYMMASTDPAGFAEIADRLPVISAEKKAIIDQIVAQTVIWCEEFNKKYPNLSKAGRPTRSSSDGIGVTSIETYCRGEISTYSEKTLKLLLEMYKKYAAEGFNMQENVVALEAGLESVDDLEELEAKYAYALRSVQI